MAASPSDSPAEPLWLRCVHEAKRGDAEAFGDLVRTFWPDQLGLARSLAIDESAAEDLLQDAFLTAWRKLPSLREERAFPAWLRRILLRLGVRGKARTRPTQPLEQVDVAIPPSLPDPDLPRLLARLPARQRAVLYLTAVEGLSDREIAETMGLRPATARVHRLRARRQLKAWLEEETS